MFVFVFLSIVNSKYISKVHYAKKKKRVIKWAILIFCIRKLKSEFKKLASDYLINHLDFIIINSVKILYLSETLSITIVFVFFVRCTSSLDHHDRRHDITVK